MVNGYWGKRPLLLPRKRTLNAAIEALLDAINILHGRKVFRVLGHNLARFELFFIGEAVDQQFRFIAAMFGQPVTDGRTARRLYFVRPVVF